MSFLAAYERIKQITHKTTQVQIAEILGIRQSSISDAKKRNSVPAEWLITLMEKYCVNPIWIKTGQGLISMPPLTIEPWSPKTPKIPGLYVFKIAGDSFIPTLVYYSKEQIDAGIPQQDNFLYFGPIPVCPK